MFTEEEFKSIVKNDLLDYGETDFAISGFPIIVRKEDDGFIIMTDHMELEKHEDKTVDEIVDYVLGDEFFKKINTGTSAS